MYITIAAKPVPIFLLLEGIPTLGNNFYHDDKMLSIINIVA